MTNSAILFHDISLRAGKSPEPGPPRSLFLRYRVRRGWGLFRSSGQSWVVVSHHFANYGKGGSSQSFPCLQRSQFRDSSFRTYDPGQAEGVPVAVVEGLPGFSVVVTDVGAIGSGGNPGFGVGVPGYGGAVAVWRLLRSGPCLAAVGGPGC